MTTWHWVRHAPTHENSFVGWRDVPADLSDTARLGRLNSHLPQRAILVSSDLSRTRATADALDAPERTRLGDARALRELDFGAWDGLTFDEVASRDPELSRAYWETPGSVKAPGGESWDETATRVTDFVDQMTGAHPGQQIIAVAHFGVILTQVQRALGLSAAQTMSHKIDNLSVTRIECNENGWRACAINHKP